MDKTSRMSGRHDPGLASLRAPLPLVLMLAVAASVLGWSIAFASPTPTIRHQLAGAGAGTAPFDLVVQTARQAVMASARADDRNKLGGGAKTAALAPTHRPHEAAGRPVETRCGHAGFSGLRWDAYRARAPPLV